jgi:hypothetical protein
MGKGGHGSKEGIKKFFSHFGIFYQKTWLYIAQDSKSSIHQSANMQSRLKHLCLEVKDKEQGKWGNGYTSNTKHNINQQLSFRIVSC